MSLSAAALRSSPRQMDGVSRSANMPRTLRAFLHVGLCAGVIALLGPATAVAVTDVFCSPFVPHVLTVGKKSADTTCDAGTIQAAIDAVVCPNTTIYLTAEESYGGEALTIADKSLSIVGSTATTCSAVGTGPAPAALPTAPVSTISGAGNGGHSVITITGTSTVTLQYVEITGGAAAGAGGAVDFLGTGSVTLDTALVDGNSAVAGGGVAVDASGGDATLTLTAYTQILNNTASNDGGGIWLGGSARLFMLGDASTIAFNHADAGHGGGIAVTSGARADIASPGAVLASAVSNNSAAWGGGIALLAGVQGDAVARLFSVDATRPVLVSQNSASNGGGGFYLKPNQNAQSGAALCAYEFRIEGNVAPQGGALYADFDDRLNGSSVYLNPPGNCGPESPASLGAVACAPGVPCNDISDNSAVNAQNQLSGSVLYLQDFDNWQAERFVMRGNEATTLITANEGFNSRMANCLIADNHSVHEVVHAEIANLTVDSCTLTQNTIDNGYVFYIDEELEIARSIVFQPGRLTFDFVADGCSSCLIAEYDIANDVTTFPAAALAVEATADPLFVDPANAAIDKRNYHLRAYTQVGIATASPAIDFAPPIAGESADLDGNPRDQDVPAVADHLGYRDLGCFEAQPIGDRVFADGFGDPVSLVY